MVTTLEAIVVAAVVTLIPVFFHFSTGPGWRPREDIADAILEHRTASVVESGLPQPMSRAPGAGQAGTVASGDADAEGEVDGSEAAEEGPWSKSDDEAEVYEVEFAKEGETVEVPENTPLLEAGEEQGWDLPFACREGQCLSCGGHIADGPAEDFVIHNDQQMLEAAELEEGYALTCVAYPQADFTLETSETP